MSPPKTPSKQSGLPIANSSASFWHSQPSPSLLNHHTTPNLPEKADIAIIGSGITGASAARYLASDPRAHGKRIVLLEAREVCWGATGRNGGHCQPLLFDRSPEIAHFERRNVEEVERHILSEGINCEWRKSTAVRTFLDGPLFEAAKTEVAKLKAADPEIGKLVQVIESEEELLKHKVQPHAKGATITQGAASLWPYKYVAATVESLVKNGRLNVKTNTPVTSITSSLSGSGKGNILHTPRGTLEATHTILATNGWTSHLLPSFSEQIVPVRCEMSALHPPGGSARLESSYGFVGVGGQSANMDDYLIQRPFDPHGPDDGDDADDGGRRKGGGGSKREAGRSGGHLMYGGGRGSATYNCVGEWRDDIVDPGEAAYLRRTLPTVLELGGTLPRWADGKEAKAGGNDGRDEKQAQELIASHQWTGIKGFSRDDAPWVGKVPGEEGKGKGLWLCAGYSGHGMPNATLCAKAVVEMVLGEEQEAVKGNGEGDGRAYEDCCERLIESGDLPREYCLTEERLRRAGDLRTVEEQDAAGVQGKHSETFVKEAEEARVERKGGRCAVM